MVSDDVGAARRHRSRRGVLIALVALTALVAGSACSGGSDEADTDSSTETTTTGYVPPNEQSLIETAREYNTTLYDLAVDPDHAATVRGYFTGLCQDEMTVADVETWLSTWIEQTRANLGRAADDLRLGQLTVADINTTEAEVLVSVVTPDDDDPLGWGVPLRQTWWVDGDEWRIDPCAESSTVDSSSDQFAPVSVLAAGFHHDESRDRWATNWAVVVRNPNTDAAAYDVEVTVDFIDGDGEVVETIEDSILAIEPGQSGALAAPADAPGAVTLRVKARAGSWAPTDEPVVIEGEVARVEPLPLEPGQTEPYTRTVIRLTNTSAVDLGAIPVVVYLDDKGAVRGGSMQEFMSFGFIPAGGSKEWIPLMYEELPEGWSMRVYVTPTAPDYEWDQLMAEEGLEEQ